MTTNTVPMFFFEVGAAGARSFTTGSTRTFKPIVQPTHSTYLHVKEI